MVLCKEEGCGASIRKRGWCDKHYARWRRHGNPQTVYPKGTRYGDERPQTRRAQLQPSVRQLAWAAGFLEGEGTFGAITSSQRISAVQVDKEPVEKLLHLFGGALRQYKKKKSSIHKTQPNPVWTWYVSGSRARGIMLTLYPLLSQRRREAIHAVLA